MRGTITTFAIITVVVLSTVALAAPPPQAAHGLQRACAQATSQQPCVLLSDLTIGPGQSTTLRDGSFVGGTIRVQTGGSLTIDSASLRFTPDGQGILVQTGGVLHIFDSTLEPRDAGGIYRLDLSPGAHFILNESVVRRGLGVRLGTSNADVAGNSFEEIPLALFLDNVVLNIHHNQFIDNDVSVNQTGGVTTLDHNLFQGGTTCVRDWLADPTITNNTFRGCHTGILHQRSQSVFRANDMEDQVVPPGVGIIVQDTNSPVIEGNTISRYGVGILVINATAYIRNNTIAENVDDGVRVVENTQPMDITSNEIRDNGGDGIHLVNTTDVAVSGNDIHGNGGDGVRVEGGSGTTLDGDTAYENGGNGFVFVDTALTATDITALGNAVNGVYVVGIADHVLTRANASENGYDGFRIATVAGASVDLVEARAIGNEANGLRGMEGTTANYGWWEGNGGAGVESVGIEFTLSAICSYWGSEDGPTTPWTDGFNGDEVLGDVGYWPYRYAPSLDTCYAEIG